MSLAKPRVLLGLLAIIAVSCRGGDGDRRVVAKPVPLLEGATKGTGARLPNGFRVAAGSLLLGDAFPRRGDPATGEQQTWDALFIVAGDPKDVMEDYVRQAQAAGFSLTEGSCSGGQTS